MAQASQTTGPTILPGSGAQIGEALAQIGTALPDIFNVQGQREQAIIDAVATDPILAAALAGQVRSSNAATVAGILGLENPQAIGFLEGIAASIPETLEQETARKTQEAGGADVLATQAIEEARVAGQVSLAQQEALPGATEAILRRQEIDTQIESAFQAQLGGMNMEDRALLGQTQVIPQRETFDIEWAKLALEEKLAGIRLSIAQAEGALTLEDIDGIRSASSVRIARRIEEARALAGDDGDSLEEVNRWAADVVDKQKALDVAWGNGLIDNEEYVKGLTALEGSLDQVAVDDKGKVIILAPEDPDVKQARVQREATENLKASILAGETPISAFVEKTPAGVSLADTMTPLQREVFTIRWLQKQTGRSRFLLRREITTPEGRQRLQEILDSKANAARIVAQRQGRAEERAETTVEQILGLSE